MYPMPGWLFQAEEPKAENKTEQQPKQPPPKRDGEAFSQLIPFIAIFVMIIFILWLPRRREQKDREMLFNSLTKGDRVLTHGGILGTVHAAEEKEDEVTVEVANGVRVKLVKAGIIRNYTAEERVKNASGQTTKKS